MTKKIKITVIAVIAAVAALAVSGIIAAVVLNHGYLDSLKKYDIENQDMYNGVEILEKDGLYYLARNGKKISKTGYTYLVSANATYDFDVYEAKMDKIDDLEIYSWYIARKQDADTYFLVNTDGSEKAVTGKTLELYSIYLPYIVFKDTVTNEYGVLSLKSFNSDLSEDAGSELSVKMYSSITPAHVNDGMQYDYMYATESVNGSTNKKYVYFDENGVELFDAGSSAATEHTVYDKDTKLNTRYFETEKGELYSITGELLAEDITSAHAEEQFVMLLCSPIKASLTDEQNANNSYIRFISAKSSFDISVKDYDVTNYVSDGNHIALSIKNTNGTTGKSMKLFNAVTGTGTVCSNGVSVADDGVIVIPNDNSTFFTYIDTETGTTLLTSKYKDMQWYTGTKALYSDIERLELIKTVQNTVYAPKAYLHFVTTERGESPLTLAYNETISTLLDDQYAPVYLITSATADTSASSSITKKTVFIPFAETTQTAAFDKVQYLDVFEDGVGLILATDFEKGKFEFIDAATGNTVNTVTAEGEEMAKTSFEHYQTFAMRNDNRVKESTAEYAVITTVKKNDAGTVEATSWTVYSRNTPMTDDERLATSPIETTDLGQNLSGRIFEIMAYSGHLIVSRNNRSSAIYAVGDSFGLELTAEIPYCALTVNYYDDCDVSKGYVMVANELSLYGLYSLDGKQIVAPVYSNITVADKEYFIAVDKNNAYAILKYNEKSGKVKQLTDFIYDKIKYIYDGGFFVSEGDDSYVFYEGKKEIDSRVTGSSYRYIRNYTMNSETGKLELAYNCVVNVGGKMYIHRAESKEIVLSEYYDYNMLIHGGSYSDTHYSAHQLKDDTTVSIEEAGVKVVAFHNADGTLIEKKIIYPTVKSNAEFTMNGVWYSTPEKKLQGTDTAVTAATVKSASGNQIFYVYKPNTSITQKTLFG